MIRNRGQTAFAGLMQLSLLLACLRGPEPSRAQDIRPLLRSGQALEESGDWGQAEQWYEIQAGRFPEQEPLAERLFECRMKTKRFEKASSLADEWLARRPGDRGWRSRKARSLYGRGKRGDADAEWEKILRSAPKDASAYLLVASGMRTDGLADRAEEVLTRGMGQTANADAFVFELADVRIERGRFREAADILLEYGAAHPERAVLVRERIDRFPRTGGVADAVMDAFERIPDRDAFSSPIAGMMMRYALQAGRNEAAYRAAVRMDETADSGRQGEGLAEFGRSAMDCGEMGWAGTAFKELLKRYPESKQVRDAWMGLMRINRSGNRWQEAVSCCDAALAGGHDEAFRRQVTLEKGRLIRDGLFDGHRAKSVFDDLIRRHPDASMRSVWETEAGQCDIITGDPDAGLTRFREALFRARRERNGDWVTPLVWTARALTYRGEWAAARDTLRALAVQELSPDLFRSPLLNDGLDLKMRIAANASCCPEALSRMARAEWLEKRRMFREAIATLDSIPENGGPLFPEALLRIAALHHALGRDDECRAGVRRFLSRFPGHESAARGLLLLGKSEERSGSADRAVEAYDRVLQISPQSAAAGEARERIRLIRKEGR